MTRSIAALLSLMAVGAAACGADGSSTSLEASWSFTSGDCASTGVETIRIIFGPPGGSSPQSLDFACEDGGGSLGTIEAGQSVSIVARGYDAGGVERVRSWGQIVTLYEGAPPSLPVNITLVPTPGNVIVSWTLSSGGVCPTGTIIPYYVILYDPPAVEGGALTSEVDRLQVTCTAGEATFEGVTPGDYVVFLDSITTVPKVQIRGPVVTVPAGEDVAVHLGY